MLNELLVFKNHYNRREMNFEANKIKKMTLK